MPVGNQWRTRGGRAATVTEEPPPPAKDPEPTGPQGRRIGRLQNFRTKSQDAGKATEASQPAKDGAAATDGDQPSSGKKTLGEKWSAASTKDEGKTVRKKRLEVTEEPVDGDGSAETMDPANVGIILENEPVRLEGVVRSDDPSEFTKPLEVEKGFAKNLASRFLQQQQDATSSEPRRFRMDVAAGEPEVHENEPVRLEGVVRSGERAQDVVGKRGTIKNIAGRFTGPQSRDSDSEGSSDEEDARRRRAAPPRRPVAASRDTGGSDAMVLAENVPAELDPSVARADGYRANDPVMESGRTRNMAERWKQQQEQDSNTSATAGSRSSKPAWLIELENAKESEYGVFENEPEVRDDVIRADDDTPDVISVQHTRSLRQMWTQIERDRDQPPPPSKPPPVKVKEPSPEPPKPPPEEPKPRFGRRPIGRLQGFGQLQKEEPAPPAAGPGKLSDGKGVRGKVAPAGPVAQPAQVEASKLYVKPSLKPIQKKK